VFELRLLGPVQAVRAGRDVPLGGPRQRAVLALLALDAGRVVPAGRLVEELWLGRPPLGAAKTLRSYVSRLRSALAPEVPVEARGGGYALGADAGQLDVARFERLLAEGQAALGGGETAAAGNRFREALALWRGPAFADAADVEPLAREAARLEELRLAAVEGRLEADLAAGMHARVAGELERLVGEHPLRERLWRLLMLALYHGGRQADALAAYQRARAVLAGELGLEPGPELQDLERAVLRQQVPQVASSRERHNLSAQLTSFLGREPELAMLGRLVDEVRLVTLTGAGGAGKTRLAVEFAAGVVDRFPDGVWLAELAGISDPGLVAPQVMEALGVRQAGDVPVIEALRWRLRSAELLLVLDNCEHVLDACAQLAGALLSSSPGLRVLATSREPLGVPGEAACPVPPLALPAEQADPAVIAGSPAVRLFLDRGALARPGAGLAGAPVAVIGRICRELDGLPLAIELAAARTSTLSVEEVGAHLADKFRFLAHRRPAANPRHQALKAAIDWSYELLPAAEQDMFRQLSVFAGDFALKQAAQVCCDGDEAAALDFVDQLVSKSLAVAEPVGGQTRYRMLETIRQYATGRLADTGNSGSAQGRHAQAFLALAEQGRDPAVLAREQDNFRAALSWSLPQDNWTGPRLARALGGFWLARGFLQEGQDWLERALATGPADPRLQADLLRLLGMILNHTDPPRAEATLSEGYRVAGAAGLRAVRARIQVQLSEIRSMLGRTDPLALGECEAAAAVLDAEGDLEGLAEAWIQIGRERMYFGVAGGIEAYERAVAYAEESGNHLAKRDAVSYLVGAFAELAVPIDVAIGRAERYLEAASGDPWAEAGVLQPLALLYGFAGRLADARAAITRARSAQTRCGAAIDSAVSAAVVGNIEMIAGNAAAAEAELKQGCDALRAMGERGFLSTMLSTLAEMEYALGRFGEAHQLTEEAEAVAAAADRDAQARWRATRAKVLAHRGQFSEARQLADDAEALIAPTNWADLQAEILVAKAEVSKLAGAPAEAAASLRTALRIYKDRRAVALADHARSALASLPAEPA
jgi:predicted ATPase/DNA-binding SARP family transcriptional activator/tetratricopeptide (TPR) repeat protein